MKEHKFKWGWVGYQHKHWSDEQGNKLYEVELLTLDQPDRGYIVRINIYTKHPRKTLNNLCKARRGLLEMKALHNQTF